MYCDRIYLVGALIRLVTNTRQGKHSGASTVALCYAGGFLGRLHAHSESSYLVDPASSHMLVSKIKPCMSKYKQVCTVKLRMAH